MANESALLEPDEVVDEAPSLRDTLEAAVTEHSSETEKFEPTTKVIDDGAPPKPETTATPTTAPETPAAPTRPETTAAPASTELKAPSQWKPQVREKWNAIPREVQEEILRREGDSMRLIGSVGPKIRVADAVMDSVQPYLERLNANGVEPMSFIQDMFTTVKSLASDDARTKAEVIANIVQSYGVDVRMLDQVLTGRISMPPEVQQARQMMTRMQYQQFSQQAQVEHATTMQAERAIVAFGADPKHEFLEEVRDLMADLVETGRANNLEDAYSAAVWANPDTRKILLQREAQSRAQSKGQRAAAARRASSAVSGSPQFPAGAPGAGNLSLRESIEAAIDEHSSL